MIDVIIRAVIHGIELFLLSFPVAIDDNRASTLSIESYAHIELFKLVYFLNYVDATTQKPLRARLWTHKNFPAHFPGYLLNFLRRAAHMNPALESILAKHPCMSAARLNLRLDNEIP